MKILHLTTFLDFGGIERKKSNLSYYNDNNNNEWVFVAINKGGSAEQKIKKNGKRVVCLNLPFRIPSILTLFKLYKFLKKENPDVLHASGAEAMFFGFFAGKMAKVRTIVIEEIGIPNHSSYAKIIFKFIYKHANWVIGESKAVVIFIKDKYNLNPEKTKVVYNFGLFPKLNFNITKSNNQNCFQILMISRLEPVKNIEAVIRVVSRLVKKDKKQIHLSIAGSGILENKLKKMTTDLDLNQHVEFMGFINNPYPYLLQSDLYVLNSHTEGFSNSLTEAMYSKTPSLSTAVGAAPEIIHDGKNGFLVEPNDENALYEKLKQIIAMGSEMRQEIGKSGHQTILQNFSLENHINALMKIYKNA